MIGDSIWHTFVQVYFFTFELLIVISAVLLALGTVVGGCVLLAVLISSVMKGINK